jgi:cytochrome c oxidase assembly protein subunit 15
MQSDGSIARERFARFAWAVLAFNMPVILWGAYVRVSYSGDGCGAHWPFCNGQVIPLHMTKPTLIEFTHRLMTGADSALLLALVALAFWLYPKRHLVRRYAMASLVFLFVEALLGAGLVLFRMVARDQSTGRVWYLSAHLTNTMLLLAALTLTAWLASASRPGELSRFRIRNATPALQWAAVATVFVSITGAVTALGDTLFPSSSLLEGVRRDLASESPLLLRLRVAHPAIAVAGAAFVIWTALAFLRDSESANARRASSRLIGLCCFQLLVGAANLSLLAPVWMQLSHLLIADVVWIAMVLVLAESAGRAHPLYVAEPVFASGGKSAAGEPA